MEEILTRLRQCRPLIHNITNYVTVNDVANIVLACGASPIMADDQEEVEEVTASCNGLNINIGTLNSRTVIAMERAGIKANQLHHPVVFDPVGVGASQFRTRTAFELLKCIDFEVIRGNLSEIKMLALQQGHIRGVDVDDEDIMTEDNLEQWIGFVKNYARKMKTVIAVTGAIDLVSDGQRCYVIYNGTADMAKVTGTGCQLSGLIAAFVAANPGQILKATATAVCAMGLAGEIAKTHMADHEGNATYRNRIIDAISQMDGKTLERGAKYEIR